MEQDIAILIADLSGYTALTEIHGSLSAADLIDKYVDIVNASLIGDSRLQEFLGGWLLQWEANGSCGVSGKGIRRP